MTVLAALVGLNLLATERPGPRPPVPGEGAATAPVAPLGTVSLTASPRLALPSSRLAGAKLSLGVDVEGLLAEPAAAPPAGPPSRPAAAVAPAAPVLVPTPGRAALSPVALPVVPVPPGPSRRFGGAPALAVMIDDLGHDLRAGWRAVGLPARLTLAFLPYGNALSGLTAAAAARGHDVFLHLPMEPEGADDPGPNAILTGLDPAEVGRRLAWAFARVPAAVGVNNHMGSRATRDPALMLGVLTEVRRRGLAFVDSRTSPVSVAGSTAARLGIPHAVRDVFLDNDPAPDAVRARLAEAERRARQTGRALAIGHPYPSTLAVLAEWLPAARARGLDLVTARELIARGRCPELVAATTAQGVKTPVSLDRCDGSAPGLP